MKFQIIIFSIHILISTIGSAQDNHTIYGSVTGYYYSSGKRSTITDSVSQIIGADITFYGNDTIRTKSIAGGFFELTTKSKKGIIEVKYDGLITKKTNIDFKENKQPSITFDLVEEFKINWTFESVALDSSLLGLWNVTRFTINDTDKYYLNENDYDLFISFYNKRNYQEKNYGNVSIPTSCNSMGETFFRCISSNEIELKYFSGWSTLMACKYSKKQEKMLDMYRKLIGDLLHREFVSYSIKQDKMYIWFGKSSINLKKQMD